MERALGTGGRRKGVGHLVVGGREKKRVSCILDLTCQDAWITWWARWKPGEVASQATRCYRYPAATKGGRPFSRSNLSWGFICGDLESSSRALCGYNGNVDSVWSWLAFRSGMEDLLPSKKYG